jgi:hypothetical protein
MQATLTSSILQQHGLPSHPLYTLCTNNALHRTWEMTTLEAQLVVLSRKTKYSPQTCPTSTHLHEHITSGKMNSLWDCPEVAQLFQDYWNSNKSFSDSAIERMRVKNSIPSGSFSEFEPEQVDSFSTVTSSYRTIPTARMALSMSWHIYGSQSVILTPATARNLLSIHQVQWML